MFELGFLILGLRASGLDPKALQPPFLGAYELRKKTPARAPEHLRRAEGAGPRV